MVRFSREFPKELLTSDEKILLEIKPSAIPFVIGPLLTLSTFLVGGLFFFAVLASASVSAAIGVCGVPLVIMAIVLVVLSYIGYLTWMNTYFAITNKRVLQKSGLFGINAFDTALANIQNVSLIQSWFFRLFGIGTLVFATSGTGGGAAVARASATRSLRPMWLAGNIVFAGVRDPVNTRKRVQELIDAAVQAQHEGEYRKMAETFKEVGAEPMARVPVVAARETIVFPPRRAGKFCEFCGNPLDGIVTFCPRCGGRVN